MFDFLRPKKKEKRVPSREKSSRPGSREKMPEHVVRFDAEDKFTLETPAHSALVIYEETFERSTKPATDIMKLSQTPERRFRLVALDRAEIAQAEKKIELKKKEDEEKKKVVEVKDPFLELKIRHGLHVPPEKHKTQVEKYYEKLLEGQERIEAWFTAKKQGYQGPFNVEISIKYKKKRRQSPTGKADQREDSSFTYDSSEASVREFEEEEEEEEELAPPPKEESESEPDLNLELEFTEAELAEIKDIPIPRRVTLEEPAIVEHEPETPKIEEVVREEEPNFKPNVAMPSIFSKREMAMFRNIKKVDVVDNFSANMTALDPIGGCQRMSPAMPDLAEWERTLAVRRGKPLGKPDRKEERKRKRKLIEENVKLDEFMAKQTAAYDVHGKRHDLKLASAKYILLWQLVNPMTSPRTPTGAQLELHKQFSARGVKNELEKYSDNVKWIKEMKKMISKSMKEEMSANGQG